VWVETAKPSGGAVPIKREGDIILALGEVTGHAHRVATDSATLLEDPITGQRWLVAPDGAEISHEEHGAISLPGGVYEILIQSDYTPEAIRNVAD
jgi:hypothetical protein